MVGAEHGRVGAAAGLEPKQAAMLRVEIEEQRVSDAQAAASGGAVGDELQYLIGAVAVLVDEMVGRAGRAGAAVRLDLQIRQRIGGDRPMVGAQLAPGDGAVIVAVDADRVIEIAQRNVPLPDNMSVLETEGEIAVARFVRRGRRRSPATQPAVDNQGGDQPSHCAGPRRIARPVRRAACPRDARRRAIRAQAGPPTADRRPKLLRAANGCPTALAAPPSSPRQDAAPAPAASADRA